MRLFVPVPFTAQLEAPQQKMSPPHEDAPHSTVHDEPAVDEHFTLAVHPSPLAARQSTLQSLAVPQETPTLHASFVLQSIAQLDALPHDTS